VRQFQADQVGNCLILGADVEKVSHFECPREAGPGVAGARQ
jgi:hypothetical protein